LGCVSVLEVDADPVEADTGDDLDGRNGRQRAPGPESWLPTFQTPP